MSGDRIVRVTLPSGGWWDIQTRPLWKHVSDWRREALDDANASGLVARTLVSLTAAWSFAAEVRPETLAQRDADDLAAVLEVLCLELMPPLQSDGVARMAEELFAEMAAGQIPARFADVHLMAATGWSWRTLRETPADVVERMWIYLAVKRVREGKGTLDFSADDLDRHEEGE